MRITDLLMQSLKLPRGEAKQKTYFDDVLKGFGVRVSVGGSKSFVVVHGKGRNTRTLGRYPDLSLGEARKKAKQVQGEIAGQSAAQLSALTFAGARDQFLADTKARTRLSTYNEYGRVLRKHFSFEMKLHKVTRQDIVEAIGKMRDQPSVEQHCFVAIRTMMNWCTVHGLIAVSPVPRLRFKSESRTRVLTDAELQVVWQRAEQVGYPYGTIVQLLILTGQRRGEIAGLKKKWVAEDMITFPTTITKNKREHCLPIGAKTKALIQSVGVETDMLFPARGKPNYPYNGWGKSKREFDAVLEIAPYTLHDLRRTYSSNLAKIGIPIHVTEKLLNHVSGTFSGVAGVYNRYSYATEMRTAVEAHETHLLTLI